MGLFGNKLFGKTLELNKKTGKIVRTLECSEIKILSTAIENLLAEKHYVARSEYVFLVPKYQKVVDYFKVLESSQMLGSFCEKNVWI